MSGMTLNSPRVSSKFLAETIVLSQELLSDILLDIVAFDDFNLRREFHRNSELTALTNSISLFVEVTTLLSKVLMTENPNFMDEIKNSHIHLLFVLKGMNQAQQKQDSVALEDLIKYELKDNLTQWKIDLIPKIKRLAYL